MVQRWLIGLVSAVAVLAVAGVGFSAFTTTAQVNGAAYAATVGLQITGAVDLGCGTAGPGSGFANPPAPGPGNFTFWGLNAEKTSINLRVTNLTPAVVCTGYLDLTNTGSVVENLSVLLETAGANGVCDGSTLNCYDPFTLSGVQSEQGPWGWCWIGSPNGCALFFAAADSATNFAQLKPGATFVDYIGVAIPQGATTAPAEGTFTILYTASAGA